ncbi:MAG: DUF2062 domain-containing protein [Pseudomonadota bacterium]
MPRKYFKRFLPSQQSVKDNRYLAVFGTTLHHHNLWHLHRRSVAGGFAVGLFCGLIPGPLQMLGAAILALILRVNLPVALLSTLYTNPLTIVPLYLVAYQLGAWVTGSEASGMPRSQPDFGDVPLREWIPTLIDWLGSLGKPLLVGLPLLALILAVSGYFAVLGSWRLYYSIKWRRRQTARAAGSRDGPR